MIFLFISVIVFSGKNAKRTLIKPDLISSDLIDENHMPPKCPRCGEEPYYLETSEVGFRRVEVLEGPFFEYARRESELFFDLKRKYLHCSRCGEDINVVDIQVAIEALSSRLPPDYARAFSMKNMRLYNDHPGTAKTIIPFMMDDFESDPEIFIPS